MDRVFGNRPKTQSKAAKASEISLGGETFSCLRKDFDLALTKIFRAMQRMESSEATMTLKMDISAGVDESSVTPEFKYKISMAIQSKGSMDGEIHPECILTWSPTKDEYVYVKKIDPQTDLFDAEDECN